jgi:hypothetical protein
MARVSLRRCSRLARSSVGAGAAGAAAGCCFTAAGGAGLFGAVDACGFGFAGAAAGATLVGWGTCTGEAGGAGAGDWGGGAGVAAGAVAGGAAGGGTSGFEDADGGVIDAQPATKRTATSPVDFSTLSIPNPACFIDRTPTCQIPYKADQFSVGRHARGRPHRSLMLFLRIRRHLKELFARADHRKAKSRPQVLLG